jgi:hypothetical protein
MGLATEPLRHSPPVPRVFFFTLQVSYSSPYSSHSYDQPFPDYHKPDKVTQVTQWTTEGSRNY